MRNLFVNFFVALTFATSAQDPSVLLNPTLNFTLADSNFCTYNFRSRLSVVSISATGEIAAYCSLKAPCLI